VVVVWLWWWCGGVWWWCGGVVVEFYRRDAEYAEHAEGYKNIPH